MRRQDRLTDTKEALDIVKDAPYAVLAAVDAQGRPYCTPVSPALYKGALYFHSAAEGGERSQALERNPCVCLSFVARSDVLASRYSLDFASAVVRGQCTRVMDLAEMREALVAIADRYAPNNDSDVTRGYIEAEFARVAVWKIEIEEITGKARHPRKLSNSL